MELLIKGITEYLASEGIPVERFDLGDASDPLDERPAELALRINPNDAPKWKYFARRLNQCEQVASVIIDGDLVKIVFPIAAGTPEGNADLERRLLLLRHALLRKFYRVNPRVRRFNVLVKPTHRCNLDCLYCYDKPFREAIRIDMDMETLKRIVSLIADYAEAVQWIWHGGEPTMVGRKWYERAYEEVFSQYPMVDWEFHMMSNGLNIDDRWRELLQKYNIVLGTSYNAFYQARLRVTSQDKPNPEADERLADELGRKLIEWNRTGFQVGVIDVITSANYKDQIAIYEWYNKHGIGVAFNHIFHTNNAEKNNMELPAEEYSREFLKYFKHWLYDTDCQISERAAESALNMVIGSRELTCTHHDCRWSWLGFNPLGEIYPCDRWVPERYKCGNIWQIEKIEDAFRTDGYRLYAQEVQKRFDTICKDCGYWDVCRGGCNASAIESSGSAEGVEPFFCDITRLNFNGVYEILRDIDLVRDYHKLNPKARDIMIRHGFYSVKEIRDLIAELGLDFDLEYDPNNLLACSEYQVFRGVNRLADRSGPGRHVDFTAPADEHDEEARAKNREARRRDLLEYLREVAKFALEEGCEA